MRCITVWFSQDKFSCEDQLRLHLNRRAIFPRFCSSFPLGKMHCFHFCTVHFSVSRFSDESESSLMLYRGLRGLQKWGFEVLKATFRTFLCLRRRLTGGWGARRLTFGTGRSLICWNSATGRALSILEFYLSSQFGGANRYGY